MMPGASTETSSHSRLSRLFGWNRRGTDIAAALDGAVDALIREDLIVKAEGFLKATDK